MTSILYTSNDPKPDPIADDTLVLGEPMGHGQPQEYAAQTARRCCFRPFHRGVNA